MEDEIKEILDLRIDCDYKRLSVDEIVILKDCLTNLQEENERLKKENDSLNSYYEYYKDLADKQNKLMIDYKSRCEKAIDNIDITIEIIKQQPTKDDTWILDRLNGFKYLLQGVGKDE